jgi:flagellar hook-associated protein 3
MRITTRMISNQYSSNLNKVTNQLNKSATTAYDFRAFEKPSENPFLAGQTFQVRRQMALNDNYASNIENLTGAASSADSILQNVSQILTKANSSEVLQGINGTSNQSDRDVIADQLLAMRDSIIADMNAQYGNRYLFAGAGGSKDAPFSVDSDGNLLYRGINVDTGENINGASTTITYNYTDTDGNTIEKSMQINFGAGISDKLNGYTVSIVANQSANNITIDTTSQTITIEMQTGSTKQNLQDLLRGNSFKTELDTASTTDTNLKDITLDDLSQITISNIDEVGSDLLQSSTSSTSITNVVDLEDLANETAYVDIGLGMKTDDDGNVIDQSAFDASMPGIKFLGYGTTTINGVDVPKNVCSLLTDMADILKDDTLSGEALIEEMKPYMESFDESQDEFTAQLAHVGTNVNFLESIDSYITDVDLNLTKRDESVEFVDAADAITNYSMQMFTYQATLQVGSNILQPTLLDFMT